MKKHRQKSMEFNSRRISREAKTINVMVGIYCKYHHSSRPEECPECSVLLNYAFERLTYCPFQAGKTVCQLCPVHCYKPVMKERIRNVMKFAGPRMLFRYPILTIFHFIDKTRKEPVQRTTLSGRNESVSV